MALPLLARLRCSDMIHDIFRRYPLPKIETRHDLIENLRFNYSLMLATENLLQVAGFDEKLEEERGHAEWLKRDIEGMGESVPVIDHEAAAIAGAQYYYIAHVDRRMLLGYMAVLECRPVPPDVMDGLEERFGKLFTVRYHADVDPGHGEEVIRQIEACDEVLRKKIYYNVEYTASWLKIALEKRMTHLEMEHG